MARVTRYECDRCGRSSNGDTASWWSVILLPPMNPEMTEGVMIVPIRVAKVVPYEEGRGKDVCGMECALSMVQDAMRSIHYEPAKV